MSCLLSLEFLCLLVDSQFLGDWQWPYYPVFVVSFVVCRLYLLKQKDGHKRLFQEDVDLLELSRRQKLYYKEGDNDVVGQQKNRQDQH